MTRRFTSAFEESFDISAQGDIIVLHVREAPQVGLQIEATAEADYAVDVGPDGTTWFENVETYEAANEDTTRIDDGWTQPEEWLRVRVSAAAAAGETADVYVAATQG